MAETLSPPSDRPTCQRRRKELKSVAAIMNINNMNIINNTKVSFHYSIHQSLQLNFPNKVSLCSEPKIKSLSLTNIDQIYLAFGNIAIDVK